MGVRMKIIGLDPGFASLGWTKGEWQRGKLQLLDGGVIITKKSTRKGRVRAVDDNLRRTREIARELLRLFDGVGLVCIEAIAFGAKGTKQNAAKQGMSIGAIATACEASGRALLQATPQEIKKATCGRIGVSKDEVAEALTRDHPSLAIVLARLNKTQREHCSDSFGAIIACLDTEEARLCLASAS